MKEPPLPCESYRLVLKPKLIVNSFNTVPTGVLLFFYMGFYQNATPNRVNQKNTITPNYHVRFSIGKPVLNLVEMVFW